MSDASEKVIAALVALLVQIILIVAGLSVCIFGDTDHSVVEGLGPSAQRVAEPF